MLAAHTYGQHAAGFCSGWLLPDLTPAPAQHLRSGLGVGHEDQAPDLISSSGSRLAEGDGGLWVLHAQQHLWDKRHLTPLQQTHEGGASLAAKPCAMRNSAQQQQLRGGSDWQAGHDAIKGSRGASDQRAPGSGHPKDAPAERPAGARALELQLPADEEDLLAGLCLHTAPPARAAASRAQQAQQPAAGGAWPASSSASPLATSPTTPGVGAAECGTHQPHGQLAYEGAPPPPPPPPTAMQPPPPPRRGAFNGSSAGCGGQRGQTGAHPRGAGQHSRQQRQQLQQQHQHDQDAAAAAAAPAGRMGLPVDEDDLLGISSTSYSAAPSASATPFSAEGGRGGGASRVAAGGLSPRSSSSSGGGGASMFVAPPPPPPRRNGRSGARGAVSPMSYGHSALPMMQTPMGPVVLAAPALGGQPLMMPVMHLPLVVPLSPGQCMPGGAQAGYMAGGAHHHGMRAACAAAKPQASKRLEIKDPAAKRAAAAAVAAAASAGIAGAKGGGAAEGTSDTAPTRGADAPSGCGSP